MLNHRLTSISLRIFFILSVIIIQICFLCACSADTPYQRYVQSYQEFMKAESFTVSRVENLTQKSNIAAEENISMEYTIDFAQQENSDRLTAKITMVDPDKSNHMNLYFINGFLYTRYLENPEQNFCQAQDSDFARKFISEGVLEFPQNVIAKQSSESIANGEILHFEFDSEKYYAYVYPETYAQSGYGGFSVYREPPVYDVYLDENGKIIEITAAFCTVNTDSDAFTQDRKYHIVFSQYGQAVPDYSGLRKNEYQEYPLSYE